MSMANQHQDGNLVTQIRIPEMPTFLKIKNPNHYARVRSASYQHLEITIYLLMATLSSTSSMINTVRDHSIA